LFFIKSGKKRTGEYHDDKEIGEHTIYHPDGKITKKDYDHIVDQFLSV